MMKNLHLTIWLKLQNKKKEEINTQLKKKKIDSDDNRIIERKIPADDRIK